MDDTRLRDLVDHVLIATGGPRRLLAALCAGVAVLAAVKAVSPPADRRVLVWAAAHDLSGGSPLSAQDLRAVALPAASVPSGVLRAGTQVVGRLLAAPV